MMMRPGCGEWQMLHRDWKTWCPEEAFCARAAVDACRTTGVTTAKAIRRREGIDSPIAAASGFALGHP